METVFAVAVVAMLRTAVLAPAPRGYSLRKIVNPFPEPAPDFRFRVVDTRS